MPCRVVAGAAAGTAPHLSQQRSFYLTLPIAFDSFRFVIALGAFPWLMANVPFPLSLEFIGSNNQIILEFVKFYRVY